LEDFKLLKAKKDILQTIRMNGQTVTKQLLIYLYSKHMQYYHHGILSRTNRDLLNGALSLIWKDNFDSEIAFHLAMENLSQVSASAS